MLFRALLVVSFLFSLVQAQNGSVWGDKFPEGCIEVCGPFQSLASKCPGGLVALQTGNSCACTADMSDELETCGNCILRVAGPDSDIVELLERTTIDFVKKCFWPVTLSGANKGYSSSLAAIPHLGGDAEETGAAGSSSKTASAEQPKETAGNGGEGGGGAMAQYGGASIALLLLCAGLHAL